MASDSSSNGAANMAAVAALRGEMSRLRSEFSQVKWMASKANDRIDAVERKIASSLAAMQATLEEFYREYQNDRTLQNAHDKLAAAERDWQQNFGRYREAREIAANVIDIVGSGFIRREALTDATERLAIRTPRYWLAPATLAVAAWLSDSRGVYDDAIDFALALDRGKSALFMALLLRDQERGDIMEEWVDSYLSGLDPTDLPKDFQVIIDAVTSDALGPESAPRLARQLDEWYEDAALSRDVEANAISEWKRRLLSLATAHDYAQDFQFLAKSQDWDLLRERHTVNTAIESAVRHFQSRFDEGADVSADLGAKIGTLLKKLAETPDPAEEEYLRAIREAKAIIETRDLAAAERQIHAEEADRAGALNIVSMVSTAAFPQPADGRLPPPTPTELLAIMLSKRLISAAAQRLDAELPPLRQVRINIDGGRWSWGESFSCAGDAQELHRQASDHEAKLGADLEEMATNKRRRFRRVTALVGLAAGAPVTGLVAAFLTHALPALAFWPLAAVFCLGGLGVLARVGVPLLVRVTSAGGDDVRAAGQFLGSFADDLDRFLAQDRRSRELLPQLRKYLQDLNYDQIRAATRRVSDLELPRSRSLPDWTPRPPRQHPALQQPDLLGQLPARRGETTLVPELTDGQDPGAD